MPLSTLIYLMPLVLKIPTLNILKSNNINKNLEWVKKQSYFFLVD